MLNTKFYFSVTLWLEKHRYNVSLLEKIFEQILAAPSVSQLSIIESFLSPTHFSWLLGIDFINKIIPVEQSRINLQIWWETGQCSEKEKANFFFVSKGHCGTEEFSNDWPWLLFIDKSFRSCLRCDKHRIISFDWIFCTINHSSSSNWRIFSSNEICFVYFQAGLDLERQYLVANKIDLIDERKIDEELGQRVRKKNQKQILNEFFVLFLVRNAKLHDVFWNQL